LAQSTVTGSVVDKVSGQPPGVNVNVQGSSNGVSTGFDGTYQLTNVKSGDKILFSYIGYKNSVVLYWSKSLNVLLEEDANQLKELLFK
jgi:iron complex outermembrane receptor protein